MSSINRIFDVCMKDIADRESPKKAILKTENIKPNDFNETSLSFVPKRDIWKENGFHSSKAMKSSEFDSDTFNISQSIVVKKKVLDYPNREDLGRKLCREKYGRKKSEGK